MALAVLKSLNGVMEQAVLLHMVQVFWYVFAAGAGGELGKAAGGGEGGGGAGSMKGRVCIWGPQQPFCWSEWKWTGAIVLHGRARHSSETAAPSTGRCRMGRCKKTMFTQVNTVPSPRQLHRTRSASVHDCGGSRIGREEQNESSREASCLAELGAQLTRGAKTDRQGQRRNVHRPVNDNHP